MDDPEAPSWFQRVPALAYVGVAVLGFAFVSRDLPALILGGVLVIFAWLQATRPE